jgi:hypothetical protein
MACAIVSGYSLDCKDVVGGIKTIYATELGNVSTIAENASGYVTAITKASGKKFFQYALEPRGQNNFTQNIQADATAGTVAYEQSVVANFVKLQYETQATLDNLIKNRTLIIVETKDGSYWLFGKLNGMEVTAGSANSGQAMNEFQGYQLTFTGMEKALANEVDPSIIAALLV